MKSVNIIGIVGIPANYGGFETLVENLVTKLNAKYNFTVFCSSSAYMIKPKHYLNSRLRYLPIKANGMFSILYDFASIALSYKKADIMLILGVSGAFLLPLIKRKKRARVIINIDGLEWKREKWNKFTKKYLKLSESIAVRYADVVISDNEYISQYILKEYNIKSELITYGGDHTIKMSLSTDVVEQYPVLLDSYCLTVCRIEPENNIQMILDAFVNTPHLKLVIIGNWHNSEYGIALRKKYDTYINIHLFDSIYNEQVLNQIRSNAYIYIHGHMAGGTNPSLVEAMFLGLPVIAYDVTYNRATTDNKSFYFSDSKNLENLIGNLTSDQLIECSKRMKTIATTKYRWEEIISSYSRIFSQ
ncbi:MAG: DUF1972 domain-containing protein [Candidatus Thermoplasmatota archaeon]|nr:DUF1972 domain-containing protein [Candidatus Thermoplasmatota archaeon]